MRLGSRRMQGGAEWGEIIVTENVSVVWAMILLTKIVTATYIHETLLTSL